MSKKRKILIADDNPHFAKALKFMLIDSFKEEIHEIDIVPDGEACIEAVNNKLYDIIFMDVNMPGKNGIEATRETTMNYRNIVVVAVSFHSEMKYVVQMIEAGARCYIIKDEINREALKKALSLEYTF